MAGESWKTAKEEAPFAFSRESLPATSHSGVTSRDTQATRVWATRYPRVARRLAQLVRSTASSQSSTQSSSTRRGLFATSPQYPEL